MHMKAIAITTGLLAFVAGIVFLALYGLGNRGSANSALPLPSDHAAKAYVLNQKLLAAVTSMNSINSGGPTFKMVQGTDDKGLDKIVWLTGKDRDITVRGSVLLRDGVTKEDIVTKLQQEKNILSSDIEDIYVSPYNYTSNQIVWFVKEKGIKHHVLSYDFAKGDFFWEAYVDPTQWTLHYQK